MNDEYIKLDTTIMGIDGLINEAPTGSQARALLCAKDMIYDEQRYVSEMKPVDRWISVEDRLPEEQQCILAYEKDYGVMWGDYQGIKYSQPVWIVRKQGLIIRTTEVTHWQPLPEPPKDGDTECQ